MTTTASCNQFEPGAVGQDGAGQRRNQIQKQSAKFTDEFGPTAETAAAPHLRKSGLQHLIHEFDGIEPDGYQHAQISKKQ